MKKNLRYYNGLWTFSEDKLIHNISMVLKLHGGVPIVAQQVKDHHCLCGGAGLIPNLAQWVEDPALSQLWHRLQLQLGFDLWPGNLHTQWVQPLKKKKKSCMGQRVERLEKKTLKRLLWDRGDNHKKAKKH